MKKQFAIVGALGRMGKEIDVLSREYFNLDFSLGIESAEAIQNESNYTNNHTNKAMYKTLNNVSAKEIEPLIGAIDFSYKESTLQSVEFFAKHQKPIVIGTTGFTAQEKDVIKEQSKYTPILLSANMSFGVNLLFELTKQASRILKNKNFQVELTEIHHKHKKDAPSGTARTLETIISENMDISQSHFLHGREGITNERSTQEVGSFALRGGDTPGDHTVYFLGEGERLELKHQAINRKIFAKGALDALLWLHKQENGLYSMSDILKDIANQ